jgi:hypothetical protein
LVLPDWAVKYLGLESGDTVCITKDENAFKLKKLILTQWETDIPGFIVMDKFSNLEVERTYASNPVVDEIKTADIKMWLKMMGQFRHDPLAPFMEMEGPVGLLGRKTLLNESRPGDEALTARYRTEIVEEQEDNGSWDDDVMKTAAMIIRLLEFDMEADDPTIKHASAWLLALPEPVGLPGLFMYSRKLVDRFNAWKSKPNAKGRPHRRESKGELQAFLENVDFTINYANDACELRLTWTTALVMEALLRAGLHDHPRVRTALNTLFMLSGYGGWCGCGYLDAGWRVEKSDAPVDFNVFTLQQENIPHHTDWFPTAGDIEKLTCGDGYYPLDMGNRRALMVKAWHNTGLCSMVMYRALSHHPAFSGSRLEAYGALRIGFCQNPYGTRGHMVYLSSMLSFLGRLSHPLAVYLALRSVPLLIRTQDVDGMWQEQPLHYEGKAFPVPSREESSFMILRALKSLGLLEGLMPK